eukprot:5542220-Amphidinium_carterae.1
MDSDEGSVMQLETNALRLSIFIYQRCLRKRSGSFNLSEWEYYLAPAGALHERSHHGLVVHQP